MSTQFNQLEDKDIKLLIRKLRKKLRQIEGLEHLQRELTDEELNKIHQKEGLRKLLFQKLAVIQKNNIECTIEKQQENLKRQVEPDDRALDSKKSRVEIIYSGQVQPVEGDEGTGLDNKVRVGVKLSNRKQNRAAKPAQASDRDEVSRALNTTENADVTVKNNIKHDQPLKGDKNTTSLSSNDELPPAKLASKKTNKWIGKQFQVRYLKGHTDVITCVAVDGDTLVTGSRDTTLKLWDADLGHLAISMGGHTGPVTSIVLLPVDDPRYVLDTDEKDTVGRGRKVISGSTDCSLRIWALDNGEMLATIYTYSPVECIAYQNGIVATGSDAGKVELWDIEGKESICSIVSFNEELITNIQYCDENRIAAASVAGLIKVWNVLENAFELIASSDEAMLWQDNKVLCERYMYHRRIHCTATCGQKLYWGDDNRNLKVFDYCNDKIYKLANNAAQVGLTDCLTYMDPFLITSSYDLDKGLSCLNLRLLPSEEYLCSIDDGATERIMSVSCTKYKNDLLRICTGGSYELRIWEQLDTKKDIKPNSWIVEGFRHSLGMTVGDLSCAKCTYNHNFNNIADSDSESDSEDDSAIDNALTEEFPEIEQQSTKYTFCTIL